MMAPDPADRFESPRAVIDALQTIDWEAPLDQSGFSPLPVNQTADNPASTLPVWAMIIGILVLLATIVVLLTI